MNTDRLLALIGVLLAIPALFEFLHSRRIEEGLIFSALVLVIIGALLYRRWEESQPLFTFNEVHKTLKFMDPQAKGARLECEFHAVANYTGLQQLWFRNISTDGSVGKIFIDGEEPQTKKKAGSWECCKQFDHPLKKGRKTIVKLEIELVEAFASAKEGISHVVSTKTKRLVMNVIFPKERAIRGLNAFMSRGGGTDQTLPGEPHAVGEAVQIDVKKPKLEAYYTIEWKW